MKDKTYKIVVTTDLSDEEFDLAVDSFLREVSARKRMDLVILLDEKELRQEYTGPTEVTLLKTNEFNKDDL